VAAALLLLLLEVVLVALVLGWTCHAPPPPRPDLCLPHPPDLDLFPDLYHLGWQACPPCRHASAALLPPLPPEAATYMGLIQLYGPPSGGLTQCSVLVRLQLSCCRQGQRRAPLQRSSRQQDQQQQHRLWRLALAMGWLQQGEQPQHLLRQQSAVGASADRKWQQGHQAHTR
jgi:hypothetical protein